MGQSLCMNKLCDRGQKGLAPLNYFHRFHNFTDLLWLPFLEPNLFNKIYLVKDNTDRCNSGETPHFHTNDCKQSKPLLN